uniref:Uncharacterized protein n=1 Tax=Cannabis sativa TaxID=3483 RepID=A0A803P4K9_CANSA
MLISGLFGEKFRLSERSLPSSWRKGCQLFLRTLYAPSHGVALCKQVEAEDLDDEKDDDDDDGYVNDEYYKDGYFYEQYPNLAWRSNELYKTKQNLDRQEMFSQKMVRTMTPPPTKFRDLEFVNRLNRENPTNAETSAPAKDRGRKM